MAPGAETLRALFGDAPTLILLDELSVYLRKVSRLDDARGQLTAFLTSLFKAVESTPNAALVYTLAIGKDGRTPDAYSTETQFVADRMAEIESVSARKATLLNPTEEDETVQVLRRRLFEHIDDAPGGQGRRRLPRVVDWPPECLRRRRRPARDRGPVPGKLPVAPARPGDTDRQDRHARQLSAGARDAAAARAYRPHTFGGNGPRTRRRSTSITSIPATSRSGRRS